MGIFSKFFNKKEKTDSQIAEKSDRWDFYFLHVDNMLASIYLNLSLAEKGKNDNFQTLFLLSLKMNLPREDGMSSQEEYEDLQDFEKHLVSNTLESFDGVFVGRLTTNGSRDFYFYVKDNQNLKSHSEKFMQDFTNYKYTFLVINDSDWSQYFDFLFPSARDIQIIMNRGVVNQLEWNGDNLNEKREVFHWIYFPNEFIMHEFITVIIDWGYKVKSQNFDKELGDLPYILSISRIDFIEYSLIDDIVLPLWELAIDKEAEYDGWETSVEKNNTNEM